MTYSRKSPRIRGTTMDIFSFCIKQIILKWIYHEINFVTLNTIDKYKHSSTIELSNVANKPFSNFSRLFSRCQRKGNLDGSG